jgi:hypothetical protein
VPPEYGMALCLVRSGLGELQGGGGITTTLCTHTSLIARSHSHLHWPLTIHWLRLDKVLDLGANCHHLARSRLGRDS